MSKVNVIIIDQIGNKEQEATLPTDVQVWRIIEALIRLMKIPTGGLDSMMFYSFLLKSSGVRIKNEQTLADAGVQDNDYLTLLPEFYPSNCPNCYPTKKVTIINVTSNDVLEAALLIEVSVIKIINRLILILGLETLGPDGKKIGYYFVQKSSGRQIAEETTLRIAKLQNGDVLELRSHLLA